MSKLAELVTLQCVCGSHRDAQDLHGHSAAFTNIYFHESKSNAHSQSLVCHRNASIPLGTRGACSIEEGKTRKESDK
jgi:hypothetical protein